MYTFQVFGEIDLRDPQVQTGWKTEKDVCINDKTAETKHSYTKKTNIQKSIIQNLK